MRDAVKAAAAGRWTEILTALGGVDAATLDGKHHPCPKCGGKDRFRLLNADAGAVLCNQCFKTKNGDGFAALGWLRGWGFRETLTEVGRFVGVDVDELKQSRKKSKRVEFEWRDWNDAIVAAWVRHKPGITVEAVKANGGRIARWREFVVIALPILRPGPDGLNGVGWVFWNSNGQPLPSKSGEVKMRCSVGARVGWIGQHALERLAAGVEPELVWQTEGPTDLLALFGAIPPADRDRHLVVSPPFGANVWPVRERRLLTIFNSRAVCVIADNDTHGVGQAAGAGWREAIAPIARDVRLVIPPETPQDLRDWIVAGSTLATLINAHAASQPPKTANPSQDDKKPAGCDPVDVADDDPGRLARIFIRTVTGENPLRIAYYCGRFLYWLPEGRWREAEDDEVTADLVISIEQEFRRLWLIESALAAQADRDVPAKRKVTNNLLASVLTHVKAYCRVAREIEFDSLLEASASEFEPITAGAPQRWISMKNGVLRLPANGEAPTLIPHTPLWWTLSVLPYNYDPAAGIERRDFFERYLDTSLQSDDDLIMPLQEFGGYCLTRDTGQQKFLLMTGAGANGKSTWCAIIAALVGQENTSNVSLDQVETRFALYQTLGKKANLTTETARYLDDVGENRLKQVTSGDRMQFEQKGKDPISATPTAKWIISANDPPRFSDKTDAIWRRMIAIPFKYTIADADQIRGMDDPKFWLQHGELPAIFNWFVDGYRRLQTNGAFTKSQGSDAAKEDMRDDSDPARSFCKTYYETVSGDEKTRKAHAVRCDDVYQEYREACEYSGHKPLCSTEFGKIFKRQFPDVVRDRRRMRPQDKTKYVDTVVRIYYYAGIVKTDADRPWDAAGASWMKRAMQPAMEAAEGEDDGDGSSSGELPERKPERIEKVEV